MSRLLAMIDEYRDAHGQPSDASIARQVGIAPQTLSSWRRRGMKELPSADTMRELARVLGRSEEDILIAAGLDTGYVTAKIIEPEPESETG
jgi:transcriptional regulator with XRE-family HTH domain